MPEKFTEQKKAFNPYIFTDRELTALFTAIDNLPSDKNEPFITEIAPTLFRLIYTCGLRPNEGRELLCKNINLDTGEILITHTKRNKERIVVMSEDMLDYAKSYDRRRMIFSGSNPYFFPSISGDSLACAKVYSSFNKAWGMAVCNASNPTPHSVRIFDLRHRFASACLNRWLDNGENLMNMLPYLRTYMGHNSLKETAYYVHILPESLIKTTAVDWSAFNSIYPEVTV